MSIRKQIKADAKRAIKPNYKTAVIVMIIYFVTVALASLVIVVPNIIDGIYFDAYKNLLNSGASIRSGEVLKPVMSEPNILNMVYWIILFFVVVPLLQGVYYYYLKVAKGGSPEVKDVFRYFSSFKLYMKTVGLNFNIYFRLYLWTILTMIPAMAMVAVYMTLNLTFPSMTGSAVVGMNIFLLVTILVAVLTMVLLLTVANRYFLVNYYFVQNENLKINQIIGMSVENTKGYRFKITKFQLSLMGWLVLSLIPVVKFFVQPYIQTSYAMYGMYVAETKRREYEAKLESYRIFAMNQSMNYMPPPYTGYHQQLPYQAAPIHQQAAPMPPIMPQYQPEVYQQPISEVKSNTAPVQGSSMPSTEETINLHNNEETNFSDLVNETNIEQKNHCNEDNYSN